MIYDVPKFALKKYSCRLKDLVEVKRSSQLLVCVYTKHNGAGALGLAGYW
jgi:hypothetical protein